MKITQMAFAVVLAGTTAAFAQDVYDADGDGMVSLGELQAVHTDFTEEQFAEADTNGDGMLDADELAAASEAGIIPMME